MAKRIGQSADSESYVKRKKEKERIRDAPLTGSMEPWSIGVDIAARYRLGNVANSLLAGCPKMFLTGAVLLLCLWARLGSAQEPPATAASAANNTREAKKLSQLSLEELGKIEVYSASKHSQSAGEAPASVTVVTRDEIQKYGYRSLSDILRNVRGLYITYDKVYSYLGVRGFGRPSDFNTRVLLLIDGHRTNDNLFDQAMVGTEFWIDIDLIERVEVVRGPSSALYGANAFFGIINVITRKPEEVKNLELSFEPESFDGYKGRVTSSFDSYGLRTMLSASVSSRLGAPSSDTLTNQRIHSDNNDSRDFFASFNFHDFNLQAVSGFRDKAIGGSTSLTSLNDVRTHISDQHTYVDLTYKHTLGHAWTFSNRSYYDRFKEKNPIPISPGAVNLNLAVGAWWGDEIQISRSLREKHQVTFGAELRENVEQHQEAYNSDPLEVTLLDDQSSRDWAFYLQDEYAFAPHLTVSAGLRLDKYGHFDVTVNPRVGLIYHPLDKSVFKLLYGSAFRPPNAFEALGAASVGLAQRPEKIKSVEAIWEQGLSERYNITVDVFRNNMKDLISGDEEFIFTNASSARSSGAEFELGGHFSGGLMGKLSYGYTQAKDGETHRILSNSPSHLVKLNLSVPLIKKQLFVSTDAQYEGSRMTTAGDRLGGFPVFNLTLFTPERHHLEVSASTYNLFDKRYALPLNSTANSLAQEGRSAHVKITWRF